MERSEHKLSGRINPALIFLEVLLSKFGDEGDNYRKC
jgi:hypothetical protein